MNKTDLRMVKALAVKALAQIDRALLECLEQTPLQKLTVDQLCQQAMINRSTFYKYYQDKYDLMDQFWPVHCRSSAARWMLLLWRLSPRISTVWCIRKILKRMI